MDAREKIFELLAQYKCKKLRTKRHNVYLLPSGERYTTPQSVSDIRSWDNCLAHLKVHLGISRRNKVATVGPKKAARKKKGTSPPTPSRYSSIPAAPASFDFHEKLRAAMRGQKLTHPEPKPQPHKEPTPILPARNRFHTTREPERHGVVHVWSKADIEAANIAMRAGKLPEFLQRHHQASQPETQPKENTTMLGVDQIDATIAELEAGMATTIGEQRREAENIHRLESEIAEARGRMEAASNKHNSLNDLKTNLGVLRDDIEKVRPMLGLLAKKPVQEVVHVRRAGLRVADAIKQVLDRAERPLRAGEIHKQVRSLAGGEGIAMASIYTFLSLDKKKNGDAIARHIPADGSYWRAGRSMPQAGAA